MMLKPWACVLDKGNTDTGKHKLQALVYDILPPTTAIGLEKLSANEQFFDDAQMAVSL